MAQSETPELLSFGDFTVHRRERSLLRRGIRLKLHGQPFEILLLLLENADRVVTREELQAKLWHADTFVDFENGLNAAVKKLRQVLGDSPESPRYIETVPRVGYRFIGRLERAASATDAAVPRATDAGGRGDGHLNNSRAAPHRLLRWGLACLVAVCLLGIAVAAYVMLRSRRQPVLSETDTVLLADFENKTGDPVFDDTLKQAVSFQLLQSPFLNVLSDARVNSTLRLMTKPVGTRLTPAIARDVCQRTGCKVYLTGSIKALGNQYVLDLSAINCQTGDAVVQEEAAADRKEQVLHSLAETTTNLRKRLGESLASIQKFDLPIEEVTTPSLDALQALAIGRKKQQVEGNAAAIPFFQRAIELDPGFGAAYAALGTSYSNLREPELASENLRRAYELRGKVSERERLRASAYYYHLVTGELEKATQVYELWAEVFPRDNVPRSNLGVIYGYLGQYDQAVSEIQDSIKLYPFSGVGYTNLVSHYAALNRLSDAKAVYQLALSRNLDNPYLHLNIYGVAFLEGDSVGMRGQLAWAQGRPQAENLLLSAAADTEASAGRLERARELSVQASESARGHDQAETAAEWQMNAALREAEFGNSVIARESARRILATTSNRELEILGALVFAQSGEPGHARQLVEKLEKNYPLDTAVNRYWIPSIRAAVELGANHPAKAVEMLQAALPYELGNPLPQPEIGGLLYPAYLRGQAYVQLRQASAAAAEFQKFADHRGIVMNNPLGSLARLGLARAYALNGDEGKALEQYREFLSLWKDADRDLGPLRQAQSEYRRIDATSKSLIQ